MSIDVEGCDPNATGLSFEMSTKADNGYVTIPLTVGLCLCGVILEEDECSVKEPSVDLKECSEYTTSADSLCNDPSKARSFSSAEAA